MVITTKDEPAVGTQKGMIKKSRHTKQKVIRSHRRRGGEAARGHMPTETSEDDQQNGAVSPDPSGVPET